MKIPKGYSEEEVKAIRQAIRLMRPEERKQLFERDVPAYNRGIIVICQKCGKADIHPFKHLLKCDPAFEAYRQGSWEYFWK